MDPMIGMIIPWPVSWVPVDWFPCDGRSLQIAQYQALYSIIGTLYGGDGRTTFALPDLRGKVPVGATDPGLFPRPLAFGSATTTGVAKANVALSIGVANLPAHTHTAKFSGSAATSASTSVSVAIPALVAPGATAINAPGPTTVLTSPGMATAKIYNTADADTTLKPFTASGSVTIPAITGTVAVDNTGSGTPVTAPVSVPISVSTYQPSLYINYIIAVEGIYPNRP